jgi:flagellar hook-associated protein 2
MPIAQFSGLASGIDSKALIDAIIESKEAVNKKRQAEVDYLTSQNEALNTLNTKLLALDKLFDPFRTSKAGGISKKSTSSDATVATAVVGSNSVNASYSLTVTSVADAAIGSYNQTYSATTDAISTTASGTATILVGLAGNQIQIDVAVTQNVTTIAQFVDAINAHPDASGRVSASIINVGTTASPSYKVVINTLQQGTAKGTIALSQVGGMTELDTANATIDQATNAQFSISGITGTIIRDTNTVQDVIPGMTFTMNKVGTATISVSNDTETTADKIQEIVDAYNDIVKYIAENDTIIQNANSSDKSITYGSLAKTRTDNDFLTQFRTALSSVVADGGTTVRTVADLKIATNRDGTLSFDKEKFTEQAGSDSIGATEVLNDLADSISGITGLLYQFTKLEGYIDISERANKSKIDTLQAAIANLERINADYRNSLNLRFANLERVTAEMQSKQSKLTSILSGLK